MPPLAQLTSEHISQIISLASLTLTAVIIPLVGVLLHNQKKNRTATEKSIEAVSAKVDENTKVSTEAFTVANGHNAKIVQLNERVVVAEQVVEEVKTAAEHVKRVAEEVKDTIAKP